MYISSVIKEEDTFGSKSGNGSWNGMVALVMSGNADIGVSTFPVTKDKSEVVDFTKTITVVR
jgi:hypothetical protein